MSGERKQYERYPSLAHLARELGHAEREVLARWMSILLVGMQGYIDKIPSELNRVGFRGSAKHEPALWVIHSWHNVMQEVAGLLADTRPGDWCCLTGMVAYPDRCVEHGFDPGRTYQLGTMLRRAYGGGFEHAVKVCDNSSDPHPWRSVENPLSYRYEEIAKGSWTVLTWPKPSA